MNQRPYALIVALLLLWLCSSDKASAAVDAPVAEVSLEHDTIFVHEGPTVILRLRNPHAMPIRFLWPDAMHRYPGALRMQLFMPDGKEVPGPRTYLAPPSRNVPLGEQIELAPGKMLEARVGAHVTPISAGLHQLRVSVQPAWPDGPVQETVLPLKVVDLDDRVVVARVAVHDSGRPTTVEILTVKTDGDLVVLHWNKELNVVQRLWTVSPGTEIRAEARDMDGRWPFIRLQQERQGVIKLRRLDYATGKALD